MPRGCFAVILGNDEIIQKKYTNIPLFYVEIIREIVYNVM